MINWQAVTNNLRAKYKPLGAIAREIDSNERHLNGIARGEIYQPKFSIGIKLLDLHLDHCPDRHNVKTIGEL